jgi:uncharacterized membrane protein YeaQ/YmgE (transglycosylase-associated protein family)
LWETIDGTASGLRRLRCMNFSNEHLLVILFVGIVAGWLAGKVVRGSGFGLIGDLLIGVIGAFIASLIFPRLGVQLGTGIVSEIVYSALGAIILLLVVGLFRRRFP